MLRKRFLFVFGNTVDDIFVGSLNGMNFFVALKTIHLGVGVAAS